MASPTLTELPDRNLLSVSGEDRFGFLQGLVSNDMTEVESGRAIYAFFLTPQGKYLFELFIIPDGDRLLIDCERARVSDLFRRLKMYKLRSKVTLEDLGEKGQVFAAFGDGLETMMADGIDAPGQVGRIEGDALIYRDPRLADLGARVAAPDGAEETISGAIVDGNAGHYHLHRLRLGVPDGAQDFIPEKSTLLENNVDQLNGLSWTKGCYMGQELTARMHYRGLVKRRLFPVTLSAETVPAGTPVLQDEREVGEMRSSNGGFGLAMVRADAASKATSGSHPLATADGVSLTPWVPEWATFTLDDQVAKTD